MVLETNAAITIIKKYFLIYQMYTLFRPKSSFFRSGRKLWPGNDKNGVACHRPSFKFKQIIKKPPKTQQKPCRIKSCNRAIVQSCNRVLPAVALAKAGNSRFAVLPGFGFAELVLPEPDSVPPFGRQLLAFPSQNKNTG